MTMLDRKTEEKLAFALGQKVSLLTKISDLTKQIEVRSRQKEIDLEDLAAKRQVLMDRVKKCDGMIGRCAEALDEDSRARLRRIAAGEAPRDCSPEETALLQLSRKSLALLRSIIAENSVAVACVRERRNRVRKRLSKLRESGNAAGGGMFHSR